jgi:predicted transposase/invertase (TIGR01784 family)
MRYLDPKNDLTFKKVFGQHPHLLKSLLNALLPLPEDRPIVSLEYLPAELVPPIPVFKNSIVDVRCMDAVGRQFIVEMQMLWTDSFYQRVVFNASKAYVKQIKSGEDYDQLETVYSLNLIDDTFTPASDTAYYHHYQIVNIANTERRIEGLEFVFVELPKFVPKTYTEKKLRALWLRYLTEIEDQTTEISHELLEEPDIREAVTFLEESAFTVGELNAYDAYWDSIRVERTRINDSLKVGLEQGRQEGLEKGQKIGLEKGERIGLEKGERIGLEKALQSLMNKGIPVEEARSMLGLS